MYKLDFSDEGKISLTYLDKTIGQRVLNKLKWLTQNIAVTNPLVMYEVNHNDKVITSFIKLVIEKRFINEALEKGYGVSAVSKAVARLKQEIQMLGNYRNLLGSLIINTPCGLCRRVLHSKIKTYPLCPRNQFLNLSREYIN